MGNWIDAAYSFDYSDTMSFDVNRYDVGNSRDLIKALRDDPEVSVADFNIDVNEIIRLDAQDIVSSMVIERDTGIDMDDDIKKDLDDIAGVIEIARDDNGVSFESDTYELLIKIDKDGYLSNQIGPMGKDYFDAKRIDLFGKSPDKHTGVDFSRDVQAETDSKDLSRSRSMVKEISAQLDAITGPVDEHTADKYSVPVTLGAEMDAFFAKHGRNLDGSKIVTESVEQPVVDKGTVSKSKIKSSKTLDDGFSL